MTAGPQNATTRNQNLRVMGLLVAYVASMAYSLFLAGATHNLPSIWTANAVVIAGALVLPTKARWVLIVLTSLLDVGIEMAARVGWRFTLIVAPQDMLQVVVTAWTLRKLGLTNHMRSPWGLARVTAAASVVILCLSTLTSISLALSDGKLPLDGWMNWVTPNVLGIVLILPTTLILIDRRHQPLFDAPAWQMAVLTLLMVMTAVAIFNWEPDLQALLFAPAMLAVFRGGPRAAAIVVVASLAASIPAVLHRTGVDPRVALTPLRHALIFHAMLFAVCLMAAMILERQKRLQTLMARGRDAAFAAEARARAANKSKSEFLATISHEIRTPLNSILGFADLVGDDPGLSSENVRRVDLIGRAGRSLVEIINDLLDFSKLEAGRMELDPRPVSPVIVLRDALEIVAPSAEAKALDLRVEIVGEAVSGMLFALDETRLRQILLNLLSNAVKFTREGAVAARLDLAKAAEGRIRFEVIDSGIGIAPDVQARLFQRFTQADSSISRGFGGTGLGLAISRALVTSMGGEIGVDSTPGRGSRFWFVLPAEPAELSTTQGVDLPQASNSRGARVLLVDDHPVNRELGHALLTMGGHEAVTTEDGAAAVALMRAEDFDLILMDVHMPGMDGLAATRAIRALPGSKGAVPILALSADAMPEQVARCLAAGMDGHVAKPIVRDTLLAAVARFTAEPPEIVAAQSSVK